MQSFVSNSREACHACAVRDRTICAFARLSGPGLPRRATRSVAPGTDLLSQGGWTDSLYVLLGGWGCLYELLEDGRRQILRFLLPGDVAGFGIEDDGASFGVQAITALDVCAFPRDEFLRLAGRQPEFAIAVSRFLMRQEALALEHLTSLGRRTARERIAHLLLELFYRARTAIPNEQEEIFLPLSQTHIGDALGLTAVHVNRMLRSLREAGILSIRGQRLRILDPDRLAAAAGFEREVSMPGLLNVRRPLISDSARPDTPSDGA